MAPSKRRVGVRMFRSVGVIACCWVLGGCTGVVRNAAQTAVPIVVSSGLGELATPQSQAQLKSIAASPAVQEAGYGVGLGIGRGILDEGTAFLGGSAAKSDEPPTAVGIAATGQQGGGSAPTANAPTTKMGVKPATGPAAATQPAGAATQPTGAARGMAFLESNLTPMVGGVVRSGVAEGMAQASGTAGRAEVRAMAESAGDGFMTGMAKAAERDGAPALGRMLKDRFDPAMDGLTARMGTAVDDALRRVGPAVHDILEQQVAPAARDLVAECVRDTLKMPVRPENAPDVVANAHNISTGAGQATHEALIGMGLLDPSGRWAWQLRLGLWVAAGLATLVGLAALVLLVLRILIARAEWRQMGPAKP